MITLTRLDGSTVHVNFDLIVAIEAAAGTVLKLMNGDTMRVSESADVVVDRCQDARADVLRRAFGVRVPAAIVDVVPGLQTDPARAQLLTTP
ncbi:MAG TPA: flagellar FlbD family protein [Myxococcota bacterium]